MVRGTLLLVFLLLFACSKDRMAALQDGRNPSVYVTNAALEQAKQGLRDPLVIKFFDFGYAEGANPNVKPLTSDRSDETELLNGVAYELLRLNQTYNIVPTMLARVGFPYWSRSEIFEDGNTGQPVVLLPFAHLNSDSVEAVLLATPLSDSVGWYTTLYTRKHIDSLTATTALDTDGLGFKVASFVFLDHKLFGTTAQSLLDWLARQNLSPSTQDRCGVISWCIDIFGAVFPLTDKPVRDRTLQCFTFSTPCTGASAGSGASNCALNENFVWVCDYMLGNWEANGGGSGGGSANVDPGSTSAGDVGTNILNLYNNGIVSEEVMNQLLTLHFAIGLTQNEIIVFLAKPQLREALVEFLSANAGSAHPLAPIAIKYVLAFAIQHDLTPAQFQTLLGNNALFQQVKALAEGLNLNIASVTWLIGNPDAAAGMHQFYTSHEGLENTNASILLLLEYAMTNNIADPFQANFQDYGENAFACGPCFSAAWSVEYAILKRDQPCPSGDRVCDWKLRAMATWNVIGTGVHVLLDLAGMVPVIGEIADLTNGVLYTLEGNYADASLSYAGAIPFVGWTATGAKYARKVINLGGNTMELKYIVRNDGMIQFGENLEAARKQMRTILKTPAGHQAHHIIPWQFWNHPVVQAAADVKIDGFHMNELLNGISLPTSAGSGLPKHLGSHPAYDDRVEASLIAIADDLGNNMSPTVAAQRLRSLIQDIDAKIRSTPGGSINDVSGW